MEKIRKIGRTLMWIVIILIGISVGLPILYRYISIPITPMMISKTFSQVGEGKRMKLAYQWVPIDSIEPSLTKGIWATTDEQFFFHNGFLPDSISPSPTISQQTASNIFLINNNTILDRCLNTYFTILIETFWSKRRILETYLNTLEMGDGIYGAEALSIEKFGCHASDLTEYQSTMIILSMKDIKVLDCANPTQEMYDDQLRLLQQIKEIEIADDFIIRYQEAEEVD